MYRTNILQAVKQEEGIFLETIETKKLQLKQQRLAP
jgi:hypothetical protein